ncbi:MAG: InlB B-repeat-containing protein, partial [Malacoplasma sp.]|nr:InlB B-repeat-containing protein [Malacoplasma sp.]
SYDAWQNVELKAIPEEGYKFIQWSDNDISNPRSFRVNKSLSLSAIFERIKYNLAISSEGWGTVSIFEKDGVTPLFVTTHNQDFNNKIGSGELTIKAEPDVDNGYVFSHWDNDLNDTDPTKHIVLSEDIAHIARFKIDPKIENVGDAIQQEPDNRTPTTRKYAVAIKTNTKKGGCVYVYDKDDKLIASVNGENFNNCYAKGTVLKIKPKPSVGHKFDGWSDGTFVQKDKEGRYTLKVGEDNINLTANFSLTPKSTLTILEPEHGSIVVNNTQIITFPYYGKFDINKKVNVTVTADEGYIFDHWGDDLNDKDCNKKITMSSDTTLVAHFISEDFALTLPKINNVKYNFCTTSNGSAKKLNSEKWNSMRPSNNVFRFRKGDWVEVVPIVEDGYKFIKWNDGTTEERKKIVFNNDKSITLYPLLEKEKAEQFKRIEWDVFEGFRSEVKYFTTSCKSVNPNSDFDVDDGNFSYYLPMDKKLKYTDPTDGNKYDMICICGYEGTLLDIGSIEQDPNTAALNFTTCQELIDDIYDNHKEQIDNKYKDNRDIYGHAKLGFVWAKNKEGKWQPYVVKEIYPDAFNDIYIFNPIHCSVIIPWT